MTALSSIIALWSAFSSEVTSVVDVSSLLFL